MTYGLVLVDPLGSFVQQILYAHQLGLIIGITIIMLAQQIGPIHYPEVSLVQRLRQCLIVNFKVIFKLHQIQKPH